MDPSFLQEYESFERRQWWFAPRRRIIHDVFNAYVPAAAAGQGRWLDVGCGTGVLLESYLGFAEKIGAELDDSCVQRAHAAGLDVRQVTPNWDFQPFGQFDCISLCDVLEHVEHEQPALQAAHAALKDGGILLVTVPALMSLWSDHDVINHHFRRYHPRQLLQRFSPEQWEVLKVSYFSTLLFPLIWLVRQTKSLAKRLSRSAASSPPRHDLKLGRPWVDRLLGGIFSLEPPLLRHGSLPIGSSLLVVARKRSSAPQRSSAPTAVPAGPPASRPLGRWLALGILAALFTIVQIRFSQDRGRLARTPGYDDVSYFVDALGRLDAIYAHGWFSLIPNYLHPPPHSPFSTYVALASYLIFGIKDWAPYVLNGGLVLALLWSTDYLMRGARRWHRVAAALLVLSVPLSANMVLEFRPDLACGLAAAMAVILPLRTSLVNASWRYRLAAGGWFAAALLCKPPVFPLTVLTVGMAWLLAALCDRADLGRQASFKRIAAAWFQCALPVLVLALPHYLADWHTIVNYIYVNVAGENQQFWRIPGGRWVQTQYFLTGVGGLFMYGSHLYIVAAVLLLGLIASVLMPGAARHRRLRAASLAIITLIAYLVPVVNPAKNPFFASEFDLLLLLGAVLVLRMLVTPNVARPNGGWGAAVLSAAALFALAMGHFPAEWGMPSGEETFNINRVVRSIQRIVYDNSSPQARVYLTSSGWPNRSTLQYLIRQEGKQVQAWDTELVGDPQLYRAQFDGSDIVVAAEGGVAEFASWLPSYKILDQTLQMIRGDPDFQQIGAVPSQTGKRFFVFARPPRFGPWEGAENLSFLEGPYPQWNLPAVRWGLYPSLILHVSAASAGSYRLAANARAPMDGQQITVMLDGALMGEHQFTAGVFESIDVPMHLTAGDHQIALKFSKSVTPSSRDSRSLAVLFDRLQLLPASGATPATRP